MQNSFMWRVSYLLGLGRTSTYTFVHQSYRRVHIFTSDESFRWFRSSSELCSIVFFSFQCRTRTLLGLKPNTQHFWKIHWPLKRIERPSLRRKRHRHASINTSTSICTCTKDYSEHEMYGQLNTTNVRDDYDLANGSTCVRNWIQKKNICLVGVQPLVNHSLCVDVLADRIREGGMNATHSAGVISSDCTALICRYLYFIYCHWFVLVDDLSCRKVLRVEVPSNSGVRMIGLNAAGFFRYRTQVLTNFHW